MIKIRNAKPEDAKNIQKVFHKTWISTYPNEEYKITREDIDCLYKDAYTDNKIESFSEKIKSVPGNSKIFVAEEDGDLLGVCRIFVRENCNQLQAIYVLPEYQGKGVGKLFWKECLRHFDKNKKIIVHVAIYNINAIKFYESLGFKDNGNRFSEERHRMPISGSLIPEMELEIKNP